MIKVLDYTQVSVEAYNSYIHAHPEATIYHERAWIDILREEYSIQASHLCAMDDGILVGIFPLFVMRNVFLQKVLLTMPYCAYCHPICSTIEAQSALLGQAKNLLSEQNGMYLEVRSPEAISLDRFEIDLSFATMILSLSSDTDEIWNKKLNKSARRGVRYAERYGFTCVQDDSLASFYPLYARRMNELGSPSHTKNFFKRILSEFGNRVEIIGVKDGPKTVAGMLLFKEKNGYLNPITASLRSYNSLYPNSLLYWTVIKKSCESGYSFFDMGRSTIQSGTYLFKKKWGCEAKQLYYHYFLNKAKNPPKANAHENKFAAAIKIWKYLPVSLTRGISRLVIPHLPEM